MEQFRPRGQILTIAERDTTLWRRTASLLGATAFRVALANALVFGVVILVLASTLYGVARERVIGQMEGDIRGDSAAFLATLKADGPAALAVALARRATAARGGQAFYLLSAPGGARLSGNLPPGSAPLGWSWLDGSRRAGREPTESGLRAFVQRLPNGDTLLIGRGLRHLHDLEDVFIAGLVWTEAGLLLFGLASGYFVSRRMLGGVRTIAAEAGRIGAGDLARRIPDLGGGEIGRIGAAVNRMLDRIEALTESLRQVTGDIAHDLRTPLSRLRQRLERASLRGLEGPAGQAVIEGALAEVDAIIATFNALLRIAQIEAGERERGFTEVDLSDLVSRLAEAYGPAAEDAGRVFLVAIAPGVRVRGDADLLGQMGANLIENALHHTPPATPLTLALERGAAGPRLVVADHGPGIAPEARERVLRRFVRLDASRGSPGTGLGLALVKAVADLHHARLALADNLPGLRVSLEFRAALPPPARQAPPAVPA